MDYEKKVHNELLNLFPDYILELNSDKDIRKFFNITQGGIDHFIETERFILVVQTKTGKTVTQEQLTYFKTCIDEIKKTEQINKPVYKFFLSTNKDLSQNQLEYARKNDIYFVKTVQEIYQILQNSNILDDYENEEKQIVLRDYQLTTINYFISDFQNGHKGFIIQLPTGAGKTVIAVKICEFVFNLTQKPVLWMTEKTDILQSQKSKFNTILIKEDFNSSSELKGDIIFSTTDMFIRHYERLQNKISMIVIDECHNSGAPETKRILKLFKSADTILVGLSATPQRKNNNYIEELFDNHYLQKMFFPEGVERGIILQPKFYQHFTNRLQNHCEDNVFVERIKTVFENASQKKAIGWCNTTEQANQWFRYFKHNPIVLDDGEQINVFITHTQRKNKDLEKFMRLTKNALLICVYRCREGYDDPPVDILIDLSPVQNKSDITFVQQVGRGSRLYGDKQVIHVLQPFVLQQENEERTKKLAQKLLNLVTNFSEPSAPIIMDGNRIYIKSERIQLEFEISSELTVIEYEPIKQEMQKLLQIGRTYAETKKIVHSRKFKCQKEYHDATKTDITLPYFPKQHFEGKFEGWFEYLGIDTTNFYTKDEAIARIKELGVKLELPNILKACKECCEQDDKFPPYDLWNQFYKIKIDCLFPNENELLTFMF